MNSANDSKTPAGSQGFYESLEGMLRAQVARQPTDASLHLKLLELYCETGRADAYLSQALQLKQQCGLEQKDPVWGRAVSMGHSLLPDEALFQQRGEGIEFVPTGKTAASRHRTRFGSEARFQPYFEGVSVAYAQLRSDMRYFNMLDRELTSMTGRPSSLFHARQLSRKLGGAQIYIKREDMSPKGSQLAIAVMGQALVARMKGCKTLVAGSNNGTLALVAATIAKHLGMSLVAYINDDASDSQRGNLFRLWLMGVECQSVDTRTLTNGDIRFAALEHCLRDPKSSFLITGLDAAPAPYPQITLEASAAIGRECGRQLRALAKREPDLLVARGGDNADAIGLFAPYLGNTSTRLACAVVNREKLFEPLGDVGMDPFERNRNESERKAAAILEGLEYRSVAREQAWLKASGRVDYPTPSPAQVTRAISDLGKLEGIIPPIETAFALAHACHVAPSMQAEQAIVVMLAESVEKDMWEIGKLMGVPL